MRVTSKGQVTIPQHLRRRAGISGGTEVDFAERESEITLRKAPARGRRERPADEEFAAYLDRVTGIVDLGMTTDEFMEILRGE